MRSQESEAYLELGLEQDEDVVPGPPNEGPDCEGGEVLVGLLPVAAHDGLGGGHHMVPHILRGACTVAITMNT